MEPNQVGRYQSQYLHIRLHLSHIPRVSAKDQLQPGTGLPDDLFERVFRSSFDAVAVTRMIDGVVLAANPAFC